MSLIMSWPIFGWRRMSTHSSSVSGPGLCRIESETPILPMSCSRPPRCMSTHSSVPGLDAHVEGDLHHVLRDADRVALGLAVAGVQRGDQRLERAVVRLAQPIGHAQDVAVRLLQLAVALLQLVDVLAPSCRRTA